MRITSTIPALAAAFFAFGCKMNDAPPEPEPKAASTAANEVPAAASGAGLNVGLGGAGTAATTTAAGVKAANGDPLDGSYTMTDATKDLPGTGPLVATIDTTSGALTCKLFDDKAPLTVANFIGLARGTRPWKDPSGKWVSKPAYDGTTFHRVIKGFMIQGGDAKGNGSGEPGYVVPDEIWAGATHDHAGELCMANRGPNTNGAQFFITDAAAKHLDNGYTIFGECTPVETVHAIANVPVAGEAPVTKVVINSVKISRQKGGAAAPTAKTGAKKDGG
jgi:peptidyl-prolyl cis-trans isomerase A (cyclophilin A)